MVLPLLPSRKVTAAALASRCPARPVAVALPFSAGRPAPRRFALRGVDDASGLFFRPAVSGRRDPPGAFALALCLGCRSALPSLFRGSHGFSPNPSTGPIAGAATT